MSADTKTLTYNFTDSDSSKQALRIGKAFDRNFQIGTAYNADIDPPVITAVKDITGFTFLMEVRSKKSDVTPVLILSTGAGTIVLTDAPNGKLQLILTNAETGNLVENYYCYDLQSTNLSSQKEIIMQGAFEIASTVTK